MQVMSTNNWIKIIRSREKYFTVRKYRLANKVLLHFTFKFTSSSYTANLKIVPCKKVCFATAELIIY